MAVSPYADLHRDREVAAINITPLVDVMLVLLIIFMVATPVLSQSLDLRLPQVDPTARPERAPTLLSVHVDAAGTLTLDGLPTTPAQLGARLADTARSDARTVVRIDAAGDADYQAFAATLAAVRASGVQQVMLAR